MYPRRVLLAVTGLSPQVVTETLFGLAVKPDAESAFIPTEIHVLTTREGHERVRLALLSEVPGWFHRLLVDYRLPSILFDESHIHVLDDGAGSTFEDIRTPFDNERAADFITERVRSLTADPHSAIHVSIAGGRKTMGFYLGYALSLFGREQDRLSHVLVPEPFESCWEFFYPSPEPRVITTRDNKLVDASTAEVTLAEIPFVRLRDRLPEDLLTGRARFSSTVAEAQRSIPNLSLELESSTCTVIAGGERLTMPPREFALYWYLAELCRHGRAGVHWSDPDVEKELLSQYALVVGPNSARMERAERAIGKGMSKDDWDPLKSRIKKALQSALGIRRAQPYLIVRLDVSSGLPATKKKYARFGLQLPPQSIRIADTVAAGATGAIRESPMISVKRA